MKKNYLLIAIFLSFFSFNSFAIVIEINSNKTNLKENSSSSQTNSNPETIKKTNLVLADPTVNPTASSTAICEGDNLTLTANPSGGVAPYTFFWTGPNGYVSSIENPVINNVGTANVGTYSLYIIDALSVTSSTQSTSVVVVNTKIDPEFDATLPAICKNGIAPLLSNTSTNGITGTWNPSVVSNTTTTTYLFTPDAGQCANSLSFTIFVVNNVTPKFTLPLSICLNETPPVLPNVSNNGIVGNWSPTIVSNTASGSYTFTPSSLQCALPLTVQIIVNPLLAIFIPAIPPICSGGVLANLPTTSNNGVTGTWSPAMNNTATTTYTFTPTVGQCTVTPSTMTIVVNPITAVFSPVAPICSGGVLANLPTTSNNGVTGTWSPAMNNTATTTYTFAPTAGQCTVTPATITIVVNPITAVFSPVAPICSGGVLALLPTTSNNGVTGTWSPAMNNIATTTYTFTPTAGQCTVTPATITIVVNPITAVFSPVVPICSGGVLANLPTTSNNGVAGTWSPVMNNTATTNYTFTPTAGQCTVTPATITIVVNPITAVFSPVAPICSGGVLANLPTTSNNGVAGTWSPVMNNTATTTYTFTPTAGQCTVTPSIMTIVVNPITAVFSPVAPICSGGVLANLPTTSTNGVMGTWSPAMNNTATTTYTFTPTAGQCTVTPATITIVVNPITAVFSPVAPICSGGVLALLPTTSNNGVTGTWSPAMNNIATTTYTFTPTAGQCTVAPATITIVVNPITAVFSPVGPICSGGVLANLPTTSNNGVTGTWSPVMNNTATTTYTFTPTAGQCTITPATMTIVVNPITAVFSPVGPICSGGVLANLPTTSNNGVTGTWSPVMNNTATTTYTFTPTAGQCTITPATMTIVVNAITAVFSPVAPICSGEVLVNLPTTSNNGVAGTWSPAMSNTATTTYTFTPTAGQCTITPSTITIIVNPITAVFSPVAPICSGEVLVNLPTTSNNGVAGTWSPAMSNTATTTYTFTPTAGQCTITPSAITIIVNPITAVFSPVAPICSGGFLANLPTTSNNGVTGTWSPAMNNTATTTYTFAPTAGQCTITPPTITIIVNPITAVFSPVAPICSGGVLANLPTTSNNGVAGTWSPAMNNTETTNYTFTPTAGQCTVTPSTLTIVVNPNVIPTFTVIAPICSGGVLTDLPTISNNGVTGTWLPAINNTATTTYTFTPAAGQCSLTPLTLTIVVNPVTAVFSLVAPICSGGVLAPLPTTSNNGVTGTWSPAMNNTITTTYTFTPTAGQCTATPATMTIVVNPITAVFSLVAPICSGGVLVNLPTTSNNGVTGTWSPAMNNTTTTTYTFTPTAGQCTITPATMTIAVNPITAVFSPVAPICSGGVLAPLPTTSNNGVTGTWSPAMNNIATTTYTFTPTAGQCTVTPATITIVVNPITAVFSPVVPICSGGVLANLPTTSNNGVTGTWSPAMNNTTTTTYTFTPAAGQCTVTPATMTIVVNPITAVFSPVAPICSGGVLASLPTTSNNGITGTWSPVINNTATTTYTFTPTAGQCTVTPSTLTIVVNPITAVFSLVAPICSGGVLVNLPTTSNNGVTGTWSPAMNNTTTTTYTFTPTAGQCTVTPSTMTIAVNPNVIPTFTVITPICSGSAIPILPVISNNLITGTWNPTTVSNTTSATYTFTPTAGQCALPTTLDITITPKIIPSFDLIPDVCFGSTPPSLPTTSNNGITGTWSPSTVSNLNSAIYTFTPTAGVCAAVTTLSITVNTIVPSFNAIAPICANEIPPMLPAISTNGITGTWNPAIISNTVSGAYAFTPNTGQCATTTVLNATVNQIVTASFTAIAPICSIATSPILPLTSNNLITGTWNPAIVSNTNSATYTFTPTTGQCAIGTTLDITVTPNVTPTFTAVDPICSGSARPILPTTSTNSITGTWNPATVSNTTSGTYTFTPTAGQCVLKTTMSIVVYQSPTDVVFTTTDVVNDKPDGIIKITGVTSGVAPFLYSINNGFYTTDTNYSGLLSGNYTITVRDSNGCEFNKVATIVSICMFPNAISPNNDSLNDTFNLNGCDIVKLEIFTRYGVEVKRYGNYSDQWDGTNNKGESLPGGTYFYVAEIKGGTSKAGWVFIAR